MLEKTGLTVPRATVVWALGQAVLVTVLVLVYFWVRGLTEGSTSDAVAHAHLLLGLEERFHLDVEAGLQTWLAHPGALATAANWVYIWGHWPVIIVTMIWLAIRHRDIFRRLRDAMMISGAVGMVIFATFPVAPPRLAGLGMVDTVTERSHAYRVLQAPALVNQYAALPSLHAGWNLLVGISIVTVASTATLKALGCLMPVLMAVAVVVTANHYVLDVLVGVSLVLVAHVGALALERRRLSRRGDERQRIRTSWLQESDGQVS